MYNLNLIYKTLFKNGIASTKTQLEQDNMFGKIACANSKDQMITNIGYSAGSIETIVSNASNITHVTPNVYYFLKRNNRAITGHTEQNLKQINTFVIDIDNPKVTASDIIDVALDLELMPTMLLATEKGHHVYFILDEPVFVDRKKRKSLMVAKQISKNLRSVFAQHLVGVDEACNHFGYFRCPNKHNVVFFQKECTHTFKSLMDWSIRITEDQKTELEEVLEREKQNTYNIKNNKQINDAWYKTLVSLTHIHAGKGYGRNNAIFTLSLANYQSGVEMDSCIDKMDEFNSRLDYPLNHKVVLQIIKSAYSGKYQGANKEYVLYLLENWSKVTTQKTLFTGWYKFKKKRADRVNSHAHERERDIIDYINAHSRKGLLKMSLRTLAKEFNISINTLKNALSKSDKIIVSTKDKGRYAETKIYTMKSVLNHLKSMKSKSTRILLDEIYNILDVIQEGNIRKEKRSLWKVMIKESKAYKRAMTDNVIPLIH